MAKKSAVVLAHLHDWRVERGISQAELSEQSGVARSTIARAEAGEGVGVRTPAKLARVLGITVQQLRYEAPGGNA